MTSMTVNGEAIHYQLDPETPLLLALRDASNLTGDQTWLRQRRLRRLHGDRRRPRGAVSCAVDHRRARGRRLTTIEGLSADRAHPLQQAWAAEQVSQCGRCDPGFIMALAALARRQPAPEQAELDALPNICRCGATPRILKAIARRRGAAAPTPALASRRRNAEPALNRHGSATAHRREAQISSQ